jgi:hypothetical protein
LPPEEAFPAFREFCLRHEPEIRDLVSTRLVQTNEVGRTTCLTPAFAHVARLSGNAPLHLIDIGASAGLNLLFDRYHLDYGQFAWGDGASPVRISCRLRDSTDIALDGWNPNVTRRVGVDINPVDLTSESEARWLRALVRPDRPALADLLSRAIDVAAADPPKLQRGDAVALLPGLLADVSDRETPCLYGSYALESFPEDGRREFWRILNDFGAKRDVYFIEMSGPGENGRIRLLSWRGGKRNDVQLAACPAHGQWLTWLV